MTTSQSKHDCRLTFLDVRLDPLDELSGVIHLFTHRIKQYTFWHATAEIVDGIEKIQPLFALGERFDIKVKVEADGKVGLAKMFFLSIDHNDGIDCAVIGLSGISSLIST